jgi:hypothetical protein
MEEHEVIEIEHPSGEEISQIELETPMVRPAGLAVGTDR